VAMSLVVLLQSQNRVEDYLKKLIKTKLDSLKGTLTFIFFIYFFGIF